MKIESKTVAEYLSKIPQERIEVFSKLRKTIIQNLPSGFHEEINYGMIGYVVPKSIYPDGYHCNAELPLPFINLASQKNFIGFYHLGIYADKKLLEWFANEYPKHCKYKLDMGKSCIRFKKMNDIPYELIGELVRKITVKEWVNIYETSIKKRA